MATNTKKLKQLTPEEAAEAREALIKEFGLNENFGAFNSALLERLLQHQTDNMQLILCSHRESIEGIKNAITHATTELLKQMGKPPEQPKEVKNEFVAYTAAVESLAQRNISQVQEFTTDIKVTDDFQKKLEDFKR